MYDYKATLVEEPLAKADYMPTFGGVNFNALYIRSDFFVTKQFFIIRIRDADDERFSQDLIYNSFIEAQKDFIHIVNEIDGFGDPVYSNLEYTNKYREYDQGVANKYREYAQGADYKDYGPSNPWDAPGMMVSDFVKGVY